MTTRIGVGVLVVRDGRVLLGLRRGAHGAGTWAPPGGHLEPDESVETCARREAMEETGIALDSAAPGPYSVDAFPETGVQYVTLFVLASSERAAPAVLEPDKCEEWRWFHWHALPSPLFAPLHSLHARGYVPPGVR